MRRSLLLFATLAWPLLCPAVPARAEKIVWAKSLQAALVQARRENRLVMADFYTDWCGYCKKLDRETYTDRRVIQRADRFISVKVNAEKEGRDAAVRYRVEGFPTILFLTGTGRVWDTLNGFLPAEAMARHLDRISGRYAEIPSLRKAVKNNPRDVEKLARLAALVARGGSADEGKKYLDRAAAIAPKHRSLVSAHIHVADAYRAEGQPTRAIALYSRALGGSSREAAYARLAMAGCYHSTNQPAKAVPQLRAIVAMKDAPLSLRELAQSALEALQSSGAARR